MPQIRQDSLVSSDILDDDDASSAFSLARETPQTPPEDEPDHQPARAKRGRKPKSAHQTKITRTEGPVRRSGRVAKARAAPQTQFAPTTTKSRQARKSQKNVISKPKTAVKTSGREWEVEQIVDSRIDADTYEHFYEVKWKGYSIKENTWEPKTNLSNCLDAIQAFEKRTQSKK